VFQDNGHELIHMALRMAILIGNLSNQMLGQLGKPKIWTNTDANPGVKLRKALAFSEICWQVAVSKTSLSV